MSQDKTLEELIKLAKQDLKGSIQYELLDEAEKFIKFNNIKEGEAKIYTYILYDAYVKWKGKEGQAIGKTAFFREFAKYHKPKKDWKGRYYSLNPEQFNLTEETIRLAKDKYGTRKRNSNGKRKTKK
jgi:hypothetical protein